MTGIGLIIVFILAIALMIFCISKLKIHPFLAIMAISLVFGLIAGIPLVNTTDADGNTVSGIANVIGAGFSGTFSSIGIVIIFALWSVRCLRAPARRSKWPTAWSSSSAKSIRSLPSSSWAGSSPSPCSVTAASSF